MNMTDREALLAAVLADPADDLPRLVYADYLDENGEPERAEFIRTQVAAARRPNPRYTRRQRRLLRTMQPPGPGHPPRPPGTLVRARYAWAGPVANLCDPDEQGWSFRRGFIESLTCTAADWLAHADAITAEHPVTAVTLTTVPARNQILAVYGTLDETARDELLLHHPGGGYLYARQSRVSAYGPGAVCAIAKDVFIRRWKGIAFTVTPPRPERIDTTRLESGAPEFVIDPPFPRPWTPGVTYPPIPAPPDYPEVEYPQVDFTPLYPPPPR